MIFQSFVIFEMMVVVEVRLLRISLSFYAEGALEVLREWSCSRVESGSVCFDFCMRAGGRAQVFKVRHHFTKWVRDMPVGFVK
jgi:hypothetical protein